jgi:acyl-CoA synthetase (AMP-forming)/AMP-acid ligase II
MDVVGDLVARERRSDEPVVHRPGGPSYTAATFNTEAWKAASLLRYHGVGPERTVSIADDADAQALLALFGAALLEAPVTFGPESAVTPRVRVEPATEERAIPLAPETKRVVYGGAPTDPAAVHFERDRWSENPTEPPREVDPASTLLETPAGTYTHAAVLSATRRLVAQSPIGTAGDVLIAAPLSHPGTVVAGVLAPLLAGTPIRLPDPEDAADGAASEDTVTVAGAATAAGPVVDPDEAVPEPSP